MFGTLLTMWKMFHYSPKKAEKLAEIQAALDSPELKVQKPSDTRWLARERSVRAVRRSLPALVATFQEMYDDSGDVDVGLGGFFASIKQLLAFTCLVMCFIHLPSYRVAYSPKVYIWHVYLVW